MPTIHLTTFIAALQMWCLILADISVFIKVDGFAQKRRSGGRHPLRPDWKDETVTWRARHLFKNRLFADKDHGNAEARHVCRMNRHRGDFKMMKHEHYFKPCDNGTIVIDLFHFESPFWYAGPLVQWSLSYKIHEAAAGKKNDTIKQICESGKWKKLLEK